MQIIYHGSYGKVEEPKIIEGKEFRHPTHQIAFCTEKSLKCIKFIGIKEL